MRLPRPSGEGKSGLAPPPVGNRETVRPRKAPQGFRDRQIRQGRNIRRRDRVDERIRLALDLLGALESAADAPDDDDFVGSWPGLRLGLVGRRIVLGMGRRGGQQSADREKRSAAPQRSPQPPGALGSFERCANAGFATPFPPHVSATIFGSFLYLDRNGYSPKRPWQCSVRGKVEK